MNPMRTIRLLFTTDIGDLLTAAYEAGNWAEFIAIREGSKVSTWNAFLALAHVRPWRRDFTARYYESAPWRVVRSAL